MAKQALTELSIQKLKYTGKQVTYWDEHLAGFGVRLSPRSKAYVIMYGPKRKLKTIGRYPDMALRDARTLAKGLMGTLAAKDTPSPTTPFLEASRAFLDAAAKRLKLDTVRQYEQYLTTLAFDKPVGGITKQDITTRLAIYDGKPHAQNYAYATLRALFNWCLDHEYLDKHPLLRGRVPNKTASRDRVLSDVELRRVWLATDDSTYGRIVRLLILTGQRRNEVLKLKPEDVGEYITFHTKGGGPNTLPLTPMVKDNLALPFRFNNWSAAHARLSAMAHVDFRHHDLRRTLATKLAELGVDDIVIERVLGHTVQSVKNTYNRYRYMPEIRDALLHHEAYLRTLVQPRGDNSEVATSSNEESGHAAALAEEAGP